ncbi:Hypothetical_protein [Hexamita inflata]|uniref:Hypothetical_protein n=1 Tax=Hexamita inflata TaxID=28002 RepID=A0AA86N676_9EUKA|nr:Hypothetical protein HINF_LOCUS1163 [Hexamita inflata]
MHFQTNYKSHDISKLKEPDIREKMEREIQRRSLKYFITCSFCSCPYECLDSLIIHQKKCLFQNLIVREPIETQPPPPNPQTPPVEGENGGIPPNPAPNPVNNPVQNGSNNPIPPRRTLVVGNGAKKQYSKTIHEVSRECNLADRDAIKMRVYEIIPMFQARESEAGNLLSKFFGHFTMSRYTGKVRSDDKDIVGSFNHCRQRGTAPPRHDRTEGSPHRPPHYNQSTVIHTTFSKNNFLSYLCLRQNSIFRNFLFVIYFF